MTFKSKKMSEFQLRELVNSIDAVDFPDLIKFKNAVQSRLQKITNFKTIAEHKKSDQNLKDFRLRKISDLEREIKKWQETLDNIHTIDHSVPQASELRKFLQYWTDDRMRDYCAMHVKTVPSVGDERVRAKLDLVAVKKRIEGYKQRIAIEARRAERNNWFPVFVTLTLANWKLDEFYSDGRAVRDYVREIGREVNLAQGKKKRDKVTGLKYFCVPENGDKNGRLHYHLILFLEKLPVKFQRDPNQGKRIPSERQFSSWQFWKYGNELAIPVRSRNDVYTRELNWQWPVDNEGQPLPVHSPEALPAYLTEYLKKRIGIKRWRKDAKLRCKMSRNFGTMTEPPKQVTVKELRKLRNAKTQTGANNGLRSSASKIAAQKLKNNGITPQEFLEFRTQVPNLYQRFQILTKATQLPNDWNSAMSVLRSFKEGDISDELALWARKEGFLK